MRGGHTLEGKWRYEGICVNTTIFFSLYRTVFTEISISSGVQVHTKTMISELSAETCICKDKLDNLIKVNPSVMS